MSVPHYTYLCIQRILLTAPVSERRLSAPHHAQAGRATWGGGGDTEPLHQCQLSVSLLTS
jgi:hypothetical protein